MGRILAAILVGGKGTRMEMFCHVRAKPALPFAGKYRFIDFCLSNCLHSKITDLAVFVDYQSAQLSDYIQRWQKQHSPKSNINILKPENNGTYSGTANALFQQLEYIKKHPADKILIMPSDHAYKMDYRKMLAFHDDVKADITVGVVYVPIEEASRFGTLSLNNNGFVKEYIEKPDAPKSNIVSMGIYIFNKDIIVKKLQEDAKNSDSLHDFGYSILPGSVGRDQVYAYQYRDFWRDIGTIESYYNTNLEFARPNPPLILTDVRPILTCENEKQTNISSNSNIKNSIIGAGCVIKGKVENSVLSPGVHVGELAEVKNSILFSNVFVGIQSKVDSCIADENVKIGEYCYVGFGNDRNKTHECTLLGKSACIPSHTAIARGCKILPFSNPGDLKQVILNEYVIGKAHSPPASAIK